MNQALYAHMNNKRKMKKKRCLASEFSLADTFFFFHLHALSFLVSPWLSTGDPW
jgi:hypothetical protein